MTDCKPKRPNWGMLSGGEVHSTTIAAWGHLVLMGDADGNLNKWDTTTSVPPALCLLPSSPLNQAELTCSAHGRVMLLLCCAVPCCATVSYDVCARLCSVLAALMSLLVLHISGSCCTHAVLFCAMLGCVTLCYGEPRCLCSVMSY